MPSPPRRSARRRRPLARALVAAAIACALAAPVAAIAADLTELPIERLVDLEVDAASRYAQKASAAPSAVRVITHQEIRDFGWRTLAEALASLPGLYTSYDRTYHYLGARGFLRPGDYNGRFLLLIDGFRTSDPIYDTAPVGTDALIDMDLIERIEYIPGPGSSAYGSNAFFGVINVVTRGAAAYLRPEARVTLGANGRRRFAYRQGWQFTDGELLLSASDSRSDGADHYYPEFDTDDSDGIAHGRDGEHVQRFQAAARYDDFKLSVVHASREKDDPAASYGQLFDDPRSRNVDDRTLVDLGWQREASDTLALSAHAYAGRYRYDGYFAYFPDSINRDEGDGDWFGFGAQAVSTAFDRHTIVVGIDYQRDLHQDITNRDTSAPDVLQVDVARDADRLGVFASDAFALRDGLTIDAGLRLDDDRGRHASPRLALIAAPSETTSVKLISGIAYRAPNVYETDYLFAPLSPATIDRVEAERIRTHELIVAQRLSSHTSVTASLFDYHLDELVTQVVDEASQELYFRNADEVRTRGIELALDHVADDGATFRASYTHTHARDPRSGIDLENSPHQLAGAAWSTPLGTWPLRLAIEARHVGRRAGRLAPVDGYTVANVSLTWRGGEPGLELSGSVYNLFDTTYANPTSSAYVQNAIRQGGRSFVLRATYRF